MEEAQIGVTQPESTGRLEGKYSSLTVKEWQQMELKYFGSWENYNIDTLALDWKEYVKKPTPGSRGA